MGTDSKVLPEEPKMADGAEALYGRFQTANSLAHEAAEDAAKSITLAFFAERKARHESESRAAAAEEECGRLRGELDDMETQRYNAVAHAKDAEIAAGYERDRYWALAKACGLGPFPANAHPDEAVAAANTLRDRNRKLEEVVEAGKQMAPFLRGRGDGYHPVVAVFPERSRRPETTQPTPTPANERAEGGAGRGGAGRNLRSRPQCQAHGTRAGACGSGCARHGAEQGHRPRSEGQGMTPWDKELADEEWMADMVPIVDAETIAGSALLKLIEARRLLSEANHALMCDLDTAEESETRDRIRAFLDGEG